MTDEEILERAAGVRAELKRAEDQYQSVLADAAGLDTAFREQPTAKAHSAAAVAAAVADGARVFLDHCRDEAEPVFADERAVLQRRRRAAIRAQLEERRVDRANAALVEAVRAFSAAVATWTKSADEALTFENELRVELGEGRPVNLQQCAQQINTALSSTGAELRLRFGGDTTATIVNLKHESRLKNI